MTDKTWSALPDFSALARLQESELSKALRISESLVDRMRSVEDHSAVTRLAKEMDKHRDLLRAAVGPIEDMKRLGVLDIEPYLRAEMASAGRAIDRYDAQFWLPQIAEATRLVAEWSQFTKPSLLEQLNQPAIALRAMEAMRSPWMRQHEAMLSVQSFMELQGIGHAVTTMPAFGEDLAAALRGDLGDWRDTISWPEPIFTDLDARTAFYVERGLDPALTDFPAPAFRQSIEIAGLRRQPSSLADLYGAPVPSGDDPEEEGALFRTNDAHDWLQRFEIRFRRFINQVMTSAFGANWPRHCLPNGLHDTWQAKKLKAELGGVPPDRPLIDYADFSDYVLIICKTDNWRRVFAPFFERPESVRESLQRLHPIRICTMHARPITQDDELLLYVEIKRLVRTID